MQLDDKETLRLIIREAVTEGIDAYHQRAGLTPDHWAFLRNEYMRSKENNQYLRRALIGSILIAAVAFGANAFVGHVAEATMRQLQKSAKEQHHEIGQAIRDEDAKSHANSSGGS